MSYTPRVLPRLNVKTKLIMPTLKQIHAYVYQTRGANASELHMHVRYRPNACHRPVSGSPVSTQRHNR